MFVLVWCSADVTHESQTQPRLLTHLPFPNCLRTNSTFATLPFCHLSVSAVSWSCFNRSCKCVDFVVLIQYTYNAPLYFSCYWLHDSYQSMTKHCHYVDCIAQSCFVLCCCSRLWLPGDRHVWARSSRHLHSRLETRYVQLCDFSRLCYVKARWVDCHFRFLVHACVAHFDSDGC